MTVTRRHTKTNQFQFGIMVCWKWKVRDRDVRFILHTWQSKSSIAPQNHHRAHCRDTPHRAPNANHIVEMKSDLKKKTNNTKKEHFWFHFCRLSAKKSSCMQSIVGAATRAFGVRCVCATCVWRRLSADCFLYYIKINVLSVLTTVRLRLRDGMISLNSHKLVGRCVIENNNFFLFCFMYTFDW